MSRYMEINGVVEVPDKISLEIFLSQFINFCEENNYYFGGGTQEVDENGIPIQ
ncbi:hypothetical protein [Eubacterium callanderi]|uniref:Uncharacterized protein n=1 Tax=Eubacterium callanderi TaxID=53442 RepID=E3GEK2_9FIRM|nr:hypothetical protein [Eubacterium callanderi]OEZ05767.1 hypothetical protein BUME_08640 [[Butyribacterium] methylotrophicum]ADO38118.1 hypothetical protein ELI_3149 [Eubacterium callanderi]MCB6660132.1 hypothetical protein [Eubacterium callanderi]MCB6753075.1 hypothetical protein [Eubacterium callanderi]MCB7104767.1 hypothetical protein [Eubacterium callanderi]